ncbi:MAG TPA: glutamyl-tRNA amidotransferase, partial [Alcanivorax sp.]|nr:glutamyl-tRNA amidotransferase [Alcanivorax sp.]
MSALKEQLTTAMKDAMRAKDKARLGVVRMALSAIKQIEVDERIELDDERSLAVLDKLIKQRKDSATQYRDAGRDDLADIEEAEIQVLQTFLPAPLSEAE